MNPKQQGRMIRGLATLVFDHDSRTGAATDLLDPWHYSNLGAAVCAIGGLVLARADGGVLQLEIEAVAKKRDRLLMPHRVGAASRRSCAYNGQGGSKKSEGE